MAIITKNVKETGVMASVTIWLVIIGMTISVALFYTTTTGIKSLEIENNRQWDYYRTLSGSMDELIKRQESLESNVRITDERVTTTLDNKYAKIYNLEVTLCILDEENNVINKRNVVMNNIVGINPSIDRASEVVATGMGYGSEVDIPTIGSMKEYACGLKILSVR